MPYQFKFLKLNEEETQRLMEMRVPNHDEATDNELWVRNAADRIEIDLEMAEEAIAVFLGKS